jgi:ribosomal protein S14
MPIDYSKYPKNWKTEIRPAILERAQNRCENCGARNYGLIHRHGQGLHDFRYAPEGSALDSLIDLGYKFIKIILTISHTDHDTQNNDYSNLKALCQKCHLDHDKEHHAKNARETREKKKGLIKLEL